MTKPQPDKTSAEPTKPGLGEGNYGATRRYNERLQKHIQNDDVEAQAEEAKRALEGDEKAELEQAERRAKRGPPLPSSKH